MTRTFVPSTAQRTERNHKRKQLARGNIHPVTPENEKRIMDSIKGKLSFYSFTLRKVNPDTVATTFIVRTHRPIRWEDFIRKVAVSLEELL